MTDRHRRKTDWTYKDYATLLIIPFVGVAFVLIRDGIQTTPTELDWMFRGFAQRQVTLDHSVWNRIITFVMLIVGTGTAVGLQYLLGVASRQESIRLLTAKRNEPVAEKRMAS